VRGTCNIDSCHQHSASPTAIGAGVSGHVKIPVGGQ
jgi:hypothetical protein